MHVCECGGGGGGALKMIFFGRYTYCLKWTFKQQIKRYRIRYLMCRAGETHFSEDGFAGWVNKQFGLVQLSPNRQGCREIKMYKYLINAVVILIARDNPNIQVVITHASHVCSQHLFGLPLRMSGIHRTQFDHVCFDHLPLVIWSHVFWPSVTRNLLKTLTALEQKRLTLDHCRPHSVTFGYY